MGAICASIFCLLIAAGVAAFCWYEYNELKKDIEETKRWR
jgi:hypothetical protein